MNNGYNPYPDCRFAYAHFLKLESDSKKAEYEVNRYEFYFTGH